MRWDGASTPRDSNKRAEIRVAIACNRSFDFAARSGRRQILISLEPSILSFNGNCSFKLNSFTMGWNNDCFYIGYLLNNWKSIGIDANWISFFILSSENGGGCLPARNVADTRVSIRRWNFQFDDFTQEHRKKRRSGWRGKSEKEGKRGGEGRKKNTRRKRLLMSDPRNLAASRRRRKRGRSFVQAEGGGQICKPDWNFEI